MLYDVNVKIKENRQENYLKKKLFSFIHKTARFAYEHVSLKLFLVINIQIIFIIQQ